MQPNAEVAFAFGVILAGAAMNGAFALPMKVMPSWKWENTGCFGPF